MIHISNLRTESADGFTKLIADFTYHGGGGVLPSFEPVFWLAVKDEDAHMLASDVYDAFVLIPLYIAMYYKQDLYIHGPVSKRLYKNVMNYLQRILCDFSDDLSPVNVTVDGFKVADGNPDIIGTGLSCGVDSLSTVYDKYVKEDDPDYRINALFFMNTGWYGDYDEETLRFSLEKYALSKSCADDLRLPIHFVNSNFHSCMYKIYSAGNMVNHMGCFANYSCVFGLQRAVKIYYLAGSSNYGEMMSAGIRNHDNDFALFAEPYAVPLMRTEKAEIIPDGCQHTRTQKTENISGWNIAHKYLNPCVLKAHDTSDARNCSMCYKCLRTLIAIEACGKLDNFRKTFDIDLYRKNSFMYKCETVLRKNDDFFLLDNYKFCKAKGLKLPSYATALIMMMPSYITKAAKATAKGILRVVLSKDRYEKIRTAYRERKKAKKV